MDPIKLEALKQRIEKMSKTQHIEILKILKQFDTIKLNENKSGIYINLSFLPEKAVEQIQEYIVYITEQEETLNTAEYQKSEFKKSFFDEKGDKDNGAILYNNTSLHA